MVVVLGGMVLHRWMPWPAAFLAAILGQGQGGAPFMRQDFASH
jgi:hypothetical protein